MVPIPPPGDEVRPSREVFQQEVVGALREAGLEGPLEVDEDEERLVHADRGAIDLADAYRALAGLPRDRRTDSLQRLARAFVSPPRLPDTWAQTRDLLLPHVKPRIELVAEDVRRQRGEGGPSAPHIVITDDVAMELAVPRETGTVGVAQAALDEWGIGAEDAFRTAGENLRRRSEEQWLVAAEAPGVYCSSWQDGFDTARLMLPHLFGRVPLKGWPVAVAPSPSRLYFAGADDEQGLFDLGRLARRAFEHSRSFHLFRPMRLQEDGESWSAWVPPDGHPAHEPLKLLHALHERADYDRQAWLIRRLAGAGEQVLALPRLHVFQSVLGAAVTTVTTWRSGGPSALPRTDAIAFWDGEKGLGIAPWEKVEEALPGALAELPGYPLRFRTDTFPEPWQLESLDLKPLDGPPPS